MNGLKLQVLMIMLMVFASSTCDKYVLIAQQKESYKPYSTNMVFDAILIDINKLTVPVTNSGIIGDAVVGQHYSNLTYEGHPLVFSSGFYLAGKIGDSIWANAIASADRIQDYWPGHAGSDPNNPVYKLYVVRSVDPPFGVSWQEWAVAVDLGADFYDGNGNGIYDPVDLNGNGVWDLNEDRPDMFGDMTVWCVYNDGVPDTMRRFNNIQPIGIEVHQTVFANGYAYSGNALNTLFIRYRIINKNELQQDLDSVFFSAWSDHDIGDYNDDMNGFDSLLNAGFGYNITPDVYYGINPAAFFIGILQGPPVYIPGETFTDINSNGIFDPGIDIPLDTAYNYKGLFLGTEEFPGAKNLQVTSSTTIYRSSPTQGIPNTYLEAWYYLQGKNQFGGNHNPCTFGFGTVAGNVDCSQINPVYMYSGDPVVPYGWIDNFGSDKRIHVNTGPFTLKYNEPVDIWVSYNVGRGYDALNSVTVGREATTYARNYYKTNFSFAAVTAHDDNVIYDYILTQNYPNPFNPSTKIKFNIPVSGHVSLKVYDVIGREVAVLVNEEKLAGSHEVLFKADNLPSGVYIYRITTEKFSQSRKMLLIK